MCKRDKILLYVVLIFVIIPGGISFFVKVVSYFMVEVDEGMSGFALPFFNYIFVAMGFVCLFGWACLQGHFKDIDKPALEMLRTEAELEKYELNRRRG